MSLKRDERLESKKRKAKAFMALANSKSNNDESSNNEAKKIKLEQGGTDKPREVNSPVLSAVKQETTDTTLLDYRKKLKEMQAASMQRPKIFLTVDELTRDHPMVSESDGIKQAPPLFIADVQALLLYALLGQNSSFRPRWCNLLRVGKVSKVVVVVLDSVSSMEFQQYGESLPTLKYAFDGNVEMISPVEYDSTVRQDLMRVPITIRRWNNVMRKRRAAVKKASMESVTPVKGSVSVKKSSKESVTHVKDSDAVKKASKDSITPLKGPDAVKKPSKDSAKPAKGSELSVTSSPSLVLENIQFDRTCLLMNTGQILREAVPMPVGAKQGMYKGYMFSRQSYGKVTSKSPLFAIDCEMVQTERSMMDLARVSIVNENLETVYDTFVKPTAKVINYVTRFSGITAKILAPVTTRLRDVQNFMRKLLPPDAILCGQSIGGDLRSLKMFHPYLIDTSVIFNLSGKRHHKTGLRRLADHFLRRTIQDSPQGHSSVEDAQATMELVLLKLKQGPEFGDMSLPTFTPDQSTEEQTAVKPKMVPQCEVNVVQTDGQTNINNDSMNTDTPACSSGPNTDNQGNGEKLSECDCANSDCGPEKAESSMKHNRSSEVKISDGNVKAEEVDANTAESCLDSSLRTNSQQSGSEENDAKCQSDSKDHKEDSEEATWDDAARRKMFFQQKTSNVTEMLLERIEEDKKKGVVIDEPDSVALYPEGMPLVQTNTDKARELATVYAQEESDVSFTHLYGYRDFLRDRQEDSDDEEEKKKCLWKLDRRFWKILMGTPPKSLYVVILPGRRTGDITLPARTFVKITGGFGDSETK